MATWPVFRTTLRDWSLASHRRAVGNARAAAIACSRARVEREEVAAYLLVHAAPPVALQRRTRVWVAHSG